MPRHIPRLVLAVYLAVGLAISVRTLISPVQHSVFPIFADSAKHWWSDQPLYHDYGIFDLFRYPPVFAVAITPLSVLGLRLGGILWSWLSLAVYGAGVWQLQRHVLPVKWNKTGQTVFLLLALFGALRGLWNAQSNALAVGLLLLGTVALVRQRWWQAAFWLGGSVALKLTPLAPVLLLGALWPRRLSGRLLAVVAGLFLLPFLTRPVETVWRQHAEWLVQMSHTSGLRWPGFRDGWTVWVVWQHLSGQTSGPLYLQEPIEGGWYRGLQLATAVGALCWCLWQQRRGLSRRRLVSLTLALGLGWLMLFGPAIEHSTYAFLAPLLAWSLLEPRHRVLTRSLCGVAGLLILVLSWEPLTRSVLPWLPWLWAALPLGTAFFLFGLLVQSLPLPRRAPVPSPAAYQEWSLLRKPQPTLQPSRKYVRAAQGPEEDMPT